MRFFQGEEYWIYQIDSEAKPSISVNEEEV